MSRAQMRTCQQLRDVLQSDVQPVMQQLFNDYLLTRLDARKTAGKGKSGGGGTESMSAGGGGRGGRGQGRFGRGRGSDRSVLIFLTPSFHVRLPQVTHRVFMA